MSNVFVNGPVLLLFVLIISSLNNNQGFHRARCALSQTYHAGSIEANRRFFWVSNVGVQSTEARPGSLGCFLPSPSPGELSSTHNFTTSSTATLCHLANVSRHFINSRARHSNIKYVGYILKNNIHSSCDIEDVAKTHICKLCVMLRSRVLLGTCPH